ncbi:MAG: hypothetical protein KF690_09130 [Bacteroidetes bacterium]|nr:hypothetical protein [Bacteroidota bacterium]
MKPMNEPEVNISEIAQEASRLAVKGLFQKGIRPSIMHQGVIYKVGPDGTAYRQNARGSWRIDRRIRFQVTKQGKISVKDEASQAPGHRRA